MDFGFGMELSPKSEAAALVAVNDVTGQYGLLLTGAEALAIVEEKNRVLRTMGRIELQNDVIAKLAERFAPSVYVSSLSYAETLHELVRIFYYCRSEFALSESDDDLIDWMFVAFETYCQGSLDLLEGRALDEKIRRNRGMDYDDDSAIEDDEEDEDAE